MKLSLPARPSVLFPICAFALVVSAIAIATAAADSLVSNGGFEDGVTGWSLFVPGESEGRNCRFDVVSDNPHSGTGCLRLQSDNFARFAVSSKPIPVQSGEHYHVSAWVRADPAVQVRLNTPGFAIRLNLRRGTANADGGPLYIVNGNRVAHDTPPDSDGPLAVQWTEVEAVVEIPSGVDEMAPDLFAWAIMGTIFVDDLSIEKVDASTAVTPMWQKPPSS